MADVLDSLVQALQPFAARWTGVRVDAIPSRAFRAAAEKLMGMVATPIELMALAWRTDPRVLAALKEAVAVGETSFFRHPEQFTFLASHLDGRSIGGTVRAWSAGCATGEEAYSLAACLLATLAGRGRGVEVLGSDLLEAHLEVARRAEYHHAASRTRLPLLHSVFSEGGWRVREELRNIVRFQAHNLLEEPSFGLFDVILCRNVLIYLDQEPSRRACEFLANSLAPGGLLVLGPVDCSEAPPGLVAVPRTAGTCFVKPEAAPSLAPSEPLAASALRERPVRRVDLAPPFDALALHRTALTHIEEGRPEAAQEALLRIEAQYPDYLPAALELALLHGRSGRTEDATALMKRVYRHACALPPYQLVTGPECLPAQFYVVSTRSFLERIGADGA